MLDDATQSPGIAKPVSPPFVGPDQASLIALEFAHAGLSGLYRGEYAYFRTGMVAREAPHFGVGYLQKKEDGRVPAEHLYSLDDVSAAMTKAFSSSSRSANPNQGPSFRP